MSPVSLLANKTPRAGLLPCFLVCVLSGCQSIAPPAAENTPWELQRSQLEALQSWQLRGRVNVRYDNESHTPRIIWLQQHEQYRIRLWGTFNAGNTIITGRPGFVTLEQGGDTVTASSPEALILDQLGYELPVSYLEFWVRGLPAPASQADLRFNAKNQLDSLSQDGWTVRFEDPRQYGGFSLPNAVEVSRPLNDLSLRFIGLNWSLDVSNEG